MRANHRGQPGMSISHHKRDKSDQGKVETAKSNSHEGCRAAMVGSQHETRATIKACLGDCGEYHLLCI
jgi:hypothetical protein